MPELNAASASRSIAKNGGWRREMSNQGESVRPSVVMDLGKSVVIKGDLSASEDLTIYGQMEGSINLPGYTLTIGPHANIKAAIAANSVVILGAVTGNVSAREKVEIQTTGSVTGDVESPRLAMQDGGCLCGKVQMSH
jgi:cytoskeletal protein CcmA (bactofilin family)